jgi:hypothetical protein
MLDVFHGNCKINLYRGFYTVEEAVEYLLDVNRNRSDASWKRLSREGKLQALEDDDWAIISSEPVKTKTKTRKKPSVEKSPPPKSAIPQRWSASALKMARELYEDGRTYWFISEKLKAEGLKTDCTAGNVSDRIYKMRKAGEVETRA